LGTHEVPDLLCVSFSSNDAVGHSWGPDSQEVLDVTLRTDLLVKELLAYLDEKVGRDRYILALTADHGVCPLPEVSKKQGREAGRLSPSLLKRKAAEFLNEKFGDPKNPARWLEATSGPWVFLNQNLIEQRGLKSTDVEKTLAAWLADQEGVQTVYTRTQLTGELPREDDVGRMVCRSFYPERCGDVFVVTKPYYLLYSVLTGTTHGTPHTYDTHVPLLVYGPAVRAGLRKEAITPQATAAILAQALGIKPPADAEAPVPSGLFGNPVP
jgi:hypothetical protein